MPLLIVAIFFEKQLNKLKLGKQMQKPGAKFQMYVIDALAKFNWLD